MQGEMEYAADTAAATRANKRLWATEEFGDDTERMTANLGIPLF